MTIEDETNNLLDKQWKPLSAKTKLHLIRMSEKMSVLDLIEAVEQELKWLNDNEI